MPFADKVDYWERTLSMVGEVMEMVLVVQREYMYMDNIFTTEDIIKQLPLEKDEFDKITKQWIEITSRMATHAKVLPATLIPRMYPSSLFLSLSLSLSFRLSF